MTQSQINGQTTVRDLAGKFPQTLPVFEAKGIDYCCGGGKSLADAAAEQGVDLASLLDALNRALGEAETKFKPAEKDWYKAPLGELVDHIVSVHHGYMKTALPRLRSLVPTVLKAHGAQHGDMLRQVQSLFQALDAEISSHLMKEEQVLFPYLAALESCGAEKPHACFGSARYPIRQMEFEHEGAGEALAKLREVTHDYALPADACPTFKAMYDELQRMEADLHQHIHLENNILFPRAIAADGPEE